MEEKLYTLQYNKTLEILFVELKGELCVRDLAESMHDSVQKIALPKKLKVLTDARLATMNFKTRDILKVYKTMSQLSKNFDSIANAFIVLQAKETAYSFLFRSLSLKSNIYFEVFTDMRAAKKWLQKY